MVARTLFKAPHSVNSLNTNIIPACDINSQYTEDTTETITFRIQQATITIIKCNIHSHSKTSERQRANVKHC